MGSDKFVLCISNFYACELQLWQTLYYYWYLGLHWDFFQDIRAVPGYFHSIYASRFLWTRSLFFPSLLHIKSKVKHGIILKCSFNTDIQWTSLKDKFCICCSEMNTFLWEVVKYLSLEVFHCSLDLALRRRGWTRQSRGSFQTYFPMIPLRLCSNFLLMVLVVKCKLHLYTR